MSNTAEKPNPFQALAKRLEERADLLEENSREADSVGEMQGTVLVLERGAQELRRVCRELAAVIKEVGDRPYQYNRNQLKGLLMLAYGPIIPAPVANEYADRVLDLLDNNEEVRLLIERCKDAQP